MKEGVALVTGAARGIGRAIAERLAVDALHVVLVDLAPDVKDVAGDLCRTGASASAVVTDLSEDIGRAQVLAELDRIDGPVQVLVNNAGITRDALATRMAERNFLQVLDVNLGAAWQLTEQVMDLIIDGGAIVNVSSRSYLGNIGQLNYAMSKGGLVGLTRALALELAPRVRVNAIAPGLTATEMTMAMPEHVRTKLISRVPAGRMAQPAEIAEMVAVLAGPGSGYMTGQTVLVCGGRSL